MSENAKTLGFVAIAAAVALVAWATKPSAPTRETGDNRGELLVADFDPLTASSLEIVEFDEDTATVRPFKVAKAEVKGKALWSIPSHENYPTDAKDQLADVAAGLMQLKILGVASDSPGDHALYGVVDPDLKTLKVGDTGVGTRVTMKGKDKNGKETDLLNLIIGKAVPDRTELRYVRRVGEDPVYVVAAKTDKLSTKFENWIEKDLLKLSSWDIKQLWVRDYSVDAMQGALLQRGEMTLDYNDTGDPKWKMLKDEKFSRDKWVPVPMAEDEELNTAKLDEMKTALGDLKIVDVTHKPKGLSTDLKAAEDFLKNSEAVQSLADRGFYAARIGDQAELFSNEGEVRCRMKDGVEYILRFGGIALENAGDTKKDDKKDAEKAGEKDKKSAGLDRYLFVMADFNPELIPKPQLEPLPGESKDAADAAKAEGKKADKKSEKKGGKKKPAKGSDDKGEQSTTPAAEEKKDAAADQSADKPADQSAEKDKADAKDKGDATDTAAKAERERIEKENKRKQDEYDEKVKKGQDRAKELNGRFADWYYIISDDVYRKIHVGRADVVKTKEKKEEEKKDQAKTEGAGDQAGKDHGDHPQGDNGQAEKAPEPPAGIPADELDKLKQEGPGGKE
jgi:hypothetical protein